MLVVLVTRFLLTRLWLLFLALPLATAKVNTNFYNELVTKLKEFFKKFGLPNLFMTPVTVSRQSEKYKLARLI